MDSSTGKSLKDVEGVITSFEEAGSAFEVGICFFCCSLYLAIMKFFEFVLICLMEQGSWHLPGRSVVSGHVIVYED